MSEGILREALQYLHLALKANCCSLRTAALAKASNPRRHATALRGLAHRRAVRVSPLPLHDPANHGPDHPDHEPVPLPQKQAAAAASQSQEWQGALGDYTH